MSSRCWATAGYDFVTVDTEHGNFYLETAVRLLSAADATGLIPWQRLGCRIFMAENDKRIAMNAFKSALGNMQSAL